MPELPGHASYQQLTAADFARICKLAHEQFGLDLRKGKEQLVSARLGKKVREMNCRSFHEYYERVIEDRTGEALISMIDALTTNHTSFFREPAHFEFLKSTVLPKLKNRAEIRLWSAACSTGEEPYSMAFCLMEHFGASTLQKTRILATDISSRVLAAAGKGVYPAERFSGTPPQQLSDFVLRGENRWKGWYRVREQFRAMVEFRRLNLIEPFPALAPFAVIFCRNVMIYFDKPTRETLVRRFMDVLEPGGYLFVGHAESLTGLEHQLQYVCPAVYRKADDGETSQQRPG